MLVLCCQDRLYQVLWFNVLIFHQAAGVSQHALGVLGHVIVQGASAHLYSLGACRQATVVMLQVHFQVHLHLCQIVVQTLRLDR